MYTAMPVYDGEKMAQKRDIIVVTHNYRTNGQYYVIRLII